MRSVLLRDCSAGILAAAKHGAWLSFDALRRETLDRHLELCKIMRDMNYLDQVLIPGEVGVMRHDCVHEEDSGLLIDHTAMGSSAVDRVTCKIETGEIGLPLVPRCTHISHSWQEGRCLRPLPRKAHKPKGWQDY